MAASVRLANAADRLALAISGACLIHCLAVPLAFSASPVLATFFVVPEALHLSLVLIAMPVSGYALLTGQNSAQRRRQIALGTTGLAMLIGATTLKGTPLETLVTVTGGLLLAAAHVLNWRRRQGRCSS